MDEKQRIGQAWNDLLKTFDQREMKRTLKDAYRRTGKMIAAVAKRSVEGSGIHDAGTMSGGLEREETRMIIRESWLSILPFFVLFLLNNYGLVPYFLFKKRYWQYTVSLIFVIGMICWLSPSPSANHFPKDFKRGELPLRMKENRRDQIIKMREKARKEGDVHWNESNPEQHPRGMGAPNGPGGFPKPTPFPYPPFVLRYLIHFIIAFLMVGFNIAIKLFFKSFRDEEMLDTPL